MANTGEIYMPIQTEALVRFADEDGIHRGLGIEIMKEKEDAEHRPIRVPAGLIQMSNGVAAVAHLDIDYLVGPEAAHVNVAGISGLATKTSYVMFLLESLVQVLARSTHAEGVPPDVAVILVNVKHNELLQIHEEAQRYPEGDLDMWEAMGLLAQPFREVEYLLPAGRSHNALSTRRTPTSPIRRWVDARSTRTGYETRTLAFPTSSRMCPTSTASSTRSWGRSLRVSTARSAGRATGRTSTPGATCSGSHR
jgi:uncharacterized protein